MLELLKNFHKKLVQLDASNRSLFLPKPASSNHVDLHGLDFLNSKPSFSIVENIIAGKTAVLCEVLDPRNEKNNLFSQKLHKLHRKENQVFLETGAKDFYIGYPFVHGALPSGFPIRCPLLFFPVTLENDGKVWKAKPRENEWPFFNPTFFLAYAYFTKTPFKALALEESLEDWESDSLAFRTRLYEWLKTHEMAIHFNADLFKNQLIDMVSFAGREDMLTLHGEGQLKLYPEALVGFFPQAGSYLEPDYQHLLQNPPFLDIESFFLSKNIHQAAESGRHLQKGLDFIRKVKEEHTFTPFAVDIYQENAIKAVKYGHSLVVQGPPGTGKSQLICNLAADYMARGKNVLIVCQKRAALDVVKQRMEQVGLGPFVNLVHDFTYDRAAIYEQIASQIQSLEAYKKANYQLDAMLMERNFLQTSRRIDALTSQLEDFRHALFETDTAGISAKELYLTTHPSEDKIEIPTFKLFPWETWAETKRKLSIWLKYAQQLDKNDHPLKIRPSMATWTLWEKERAKEATIAWETFVVETELQWKEKWINLPIAQSFSSIIKDNLLWEAWRPALANEHIWQSLFSDKPKLSAKNLQENRIRYFKLQKVALGKNIPNDGIKSITNALETYKSKVNSPWNRWLWFQFSKEFTLVKPYLSTDASLSLTAKMELLKNQWEAYLGLVEIEKNCLDTTLGAIWENEGWDEHAWNLASKALEIKEGLSGWKKAYPSAKKVWSQNPAAVKEAVSFSVKSLDAYRELVQSSSKFLSLEQIHSLTVHPTKAKMWNELLDKDFDLLKAYDVFLDGLREHEKALGERLIGASHFHDPTLVFENSIGLAWLQHLESKYPVLVSVSTFDMEAWEKELEEKIQEKQEISLSICLQRVRERIYRETTFNRLNNRITYRELHHQVSKKKKVWPLRKLLTQFHEEIFQLLPCWLASPESVSAIFPLEQWFDLVIFDEASQCYAEKGLPAMCRGKQIVVTGDSKQLPPNDLYQVRWEEVDEDEVLDHQTDALLDLCCHYLPQVQLMEHYRSQHLPLIAFSNQYFYKNTLRLIPDHAKVLQPTQAFAYIQVQGIWKNNQNEAEAQKVVDVCFEHWKAFPEQSIGIVTFNFKQQQLIWDKMEERAIHEQSVLPSSLIIKNIENIQGDERDVIVFSIGYAPDSAGRLIMNFGQLNTDGGENRLNVAITRAREKVVVVTSLHPQQLLVEGAKHEGPVLLKKYLEYAFQNSQQQTMASRISTDFSTDQGATSRFGINLRSKLAQGQDMHPGFSHFADIVQKANKNNFHLVLTDDERYWSALSAKDSHGYLPMLLRKKGWHFSKTYSRKFWQNQGTNPSLSLDLGLETN